MKSFEIQYISRYYEEKTYCSKVIHANSEKEALIIFANMFNIKDYRYFFQPFFQWEDGQWMSSFKCINEVKNDENTHE